VLDEQALRPGERTDAVGEVTRGVVGRQPLAGLAPVVQLDHARGSDVVPGARLPARPDHRGQRPEATEDAPQLDRRDDLEGAVGRRVRAGVDRHREAVAPSRHGLTVTLASVCLCSSSSTMNSPVIDAGSLKWTLPPFVTSLWTS
jgi:hypothetical protein